jgi:hypothetical protein
LSCIIVVIKYPTLGLLGPSFFFSGTGDEITSENENRTYDFYFIFKQGTKLVFSARLILQGVSPPVLNLPYPCLHCHAYFFLNQALSNKILQIFSADTQFNKMECKLSHFTATLGLGMKHELERQTMTQRQVDFTHNSNTISLFCSPIQREREMNHLKPPS